MIFFSSLAFTVLENAMCVIFKHRVEIRRRRFLISAIMPYCYILSLGAGMLLVTLVAGSLQVLGEESVQLFGYSWSLHGVSGVLLYLLGTGWRGAGADVDLPGDAGRAPVAVPRADRRRDGALLWELARRILVWYFSTLSQVNVVYGSMTTAIIVMFSLEIGATLLLFGAQVISEFERVGQRREKQAAKPMTTQATEIK